MKHYTLISLIIFSLTINLFTSYTNAHSSKLRNKYLRGENATLGPHVSDNTTHKRSLLANTRATMTINSFEKGGDGGDPSECDGQYHSNNLVIVALSTKWYNNGQRCSKYIDIYYNNRSVRAKVVDECDSNRDCSGDNIVDASYAVWVALQVSESGDDWGEAQITWSDA